MYIDFGNAVLFVFGYMYDSHLRLVMVLFYIAFVLHFVFAYTPFGLDVMVSFMIGLAACHCFSFNFTS